MIIQLIIIQAIIFIAIIIVLRILFYGHLNSAIKRLRELQEEALIKETQINEELERAKQEKISEVEKGRIEAKKIIEEARKEINLLRTRTEEQSKVESQRIIAQGREELERLRKSLISNIKEQATKISIEVIKYAFTEKGKENLQYQLIDELIEGIKGIEKEKFFIKTNIAEVISTAPLKEEEKIKLKNTLSAKVGY